MKQRSILVLFDDDKLYKNLINFHETTVYISNLKK